VLTVGGLASLPLALGEEYGWRGYVLRRLLPLGRVNATLIVALIWGVWHTPVLLLGLNYPGQPAWAVLPLFLMTVTLTAFLFTWMYLIADQSVMVVAVMHSVLNALTDTFTSPRYLVGADPHLAGGGGLMAIGLLTILVLAVVRYSRQDV
jgi:CAAX protease family protein